MIQVKRTIKAKVNPHCILVGDIIGFTLTDGEYVEAMAVKKTDRGVLFTTVDCLKEEYRMNPTNTNEGGYEKSELRQKLNSEILNRFPEELKKLMLPHENGDLLRIPTEREIFGENKYGEQDDAERWAPMKLRRNRMALEGHNGDIQWYWLQNPHKDYASDVADVSGSGTANHYNASYADGVRPVFLLKSSI